MSYRVWWKKIYKDIEMNQKQREQNEVNRKEREEFSIVKICEKVVRMNTKKQIFRWSKYKIIKSIKLYYIII